MSPRKVRGRSRAIATGERVFLRFPTARDETEFMALRSESEEFLRPWDPAPPSGMDAYSSEVYAAYLKGSRLKRRRRLLVCSTEDGAILGGININEIVRGVFDSAFLGYWIGARYARKRFMTEALRLVLAYAFEDLGLHRLEANIQPSNEASLALVRAAGFEKEGYSPRYLKIAGQWCDHERWALLVETWRRREDA